MNGKRWAALGIAAALFIFSIVINTFTTIFSKDFQTTMDEFMNPTAGLMSEEVIEEGNMMKKIAVLDVNGTIQDTGDTASIFASAGYNHQAFLKNLDYAKEDDTVKGIIIRVNTPGGGVVESAQIHDKIVQIQKEAKKPVYISMGSMAASGGYYISAPANKIFASPETLTGSLGVIMQGINYAGLAEKYGVKFETIKSGEFKDIMSPSREMTEEERVILQEMINSSYNGFVKVISEGRDISEDEVRRIADGRIYDGRQAKELNLIDGFGYFEDVVDVMKKDYKLKDAQVIQYTEDLGFASLFSMGARQLMGQEDVELAGVMNLLSQRNSPRLMYLYAE
ncbi:signal peptide peptidase SppA [Niallia endozanthoxylica]|uniref:Signal peptide peptidase SppA n=1 Tax=Niallia endozanthoxylica TaxID=2036016 RepID=A0A5J5HY81_9BACI|nr:signal peptide peptidase SppA [Niallia endozanthoxylica]KAA9027483.1 signal peptide peptidase SppA [Niallia endozanthoxylica]